MLVRIVAVDIGQRDQGVLARPPRQCVGRELCHFLQGQQRDLELQIVKVIHVRVQARELDVKAPRKLSPRHFFKADLVGQLRAGLDETLGCQSYAGHNSPKTNQ
jgi:hypothetical protein